MIATRIFKAGMDGVEQSPYILLGRVMKSVPGTGKVAIVQSDVNTITRYVRRMSTVNGAFGNVTQPDNGTNLTVASSIFNTLQTDNTWWKDATGYNFTDAIPATDFPGLGAYSIVYKFVPQGTAFSTFWLPIRMNVASLQGVLAEG